MPPRNPDPLDKLIAKQIHFHRMRNGMSQTRLGKNIGVTFQQVQKYEAGSNRVPGSRLVRIARALQVPVSAFFTENPDDIVAATPLTGDRKAFRLVEAFSKIKDHRIRKLRKR
jgi:transcriptional regulator with XRE-family HTH domain